jgi:hypothetical protein
VALEQVVGLAREELERRERKAQYFDNPVLWAKDVLGLTLWSRQAEAAMAVVHNKNTVVKAGHEVGKSWLAGLIACWWVDTRWDLPGGCFLVSTAPSTAQINAIVWREIRQFWQLAKRRYDAGIIDHQFPGYITSDAHWRLENGVELGYGRKPPAQDEDAMSGIHARYVLAIGDEAVGLSEGLIGDLANITSNATSRRFLICNPTNPLSYVASIFKRELSNWKRLTISCLESPNFHGGEGLPIEVLESLVDQSYIDGIIEEHGIDSPTYKSRVEGEFAWDMGFTLIRPEDIAAGLDANIEPSLETLPVFGVDFSRSKAGDKNTVYKFHDGKLRFIEAWNEPNAMKTAERVNELALAHGVKYIAGDGQGLGGPILDRIAELAQGRYMVIPVDSNFASPDIVKWYNWRAYTYWSFQDRLSRGEIDIAQEDDKLQEQLLGIEIKKRLTGRDNLLLESKEEMRKRGIHSPDFADAAVMAATDYSWVYDGSVPQKGDIYSFDSDDFFDLDYQEYIRGQGMPIL